MIQICEHDMCTACNACVQVCPKRCISMLEDSNGFIYPKINHENCIECKQCVRVCHNNNSLNKNKATFYMGWHKELDVLRKSSSGGAFTALADIILKKDGLIFGATFNEQTRTVEHICIEKEDQLDLLRLSKYYQGSTKNSYAEAKKALLAKR